ncbi:MAG: sugar phosphate nucleotidyltransferase [Planctomycetota bacterium]
MTSDSEIEGVILAAGKGTRIQPFSHTFPKPLLPVLDKPLMVWQIEAMRDLGVVDVTVVIGHLGHEIVRSLGDGSRFGVRMHYVEQESMLGIAHAVAQLEPHLSRPFLLFLGDIFFETTNLASMLDTFRAPDVSGVLAVKPESNPAAIRKNFTVDLADDGTITRVIEKPRHPRTDLKGCGLYLFDTTVFDAIRRTPRTALRDEYELTDAIQIYIDYGYKLKPASVVERDVNVSTPSDLLDLNLRVLAQRELERFVAPSATVGAGARLERCVVMDGASVAPGAQLVDCVALPGARVPSGEHARTVFSADQAVTC